MGARLSGWRYGVALAAVAAGYFGAAEAGLSLAVLSPQVSPVWPPAGLALAVMVVLGYRMWPGVALGAFLANLVTGYSPAVPPLTTVAVAAAIAGGNTLEALAGARLLAWMGFDPALQRPRHVLALAVGAAGLSTMIAATVGVTSLCAGLVHPWREFGTLWWTWWVGDAMGDLVLAPALMVWASGQGRPARPQWAEVGAFWVVLGAAGQLIFFSVPGSKLSYLVGPLFAWAALRLGQLVTAAAVVVVAALAVLASITQWAVGGESLNERLLLLQTFMGTMAVASLVLGAATAVSGGGIAAEERGAPEAGPRGGPDGNLGVGDRHRARVLVARPGTDPWAGAGVIPGHVRGGARRRGSRGSGAAAGGGRRSAGASNRAPYRVPHHASRRRGPLAGGARARGPRAGRRAGSDDRRVHGHDGPQARRGGPGPLQRRPGGLRPHRLARSEGAAAGHHPLRFVPAGRLWGPSGA